MLKIHIQRGWEAVISEEIKIPFILSFLSKTRYQNNSCHAEKRAHVKVRGWEWLEEGGRGGERDLCNHTQKRQYAITIRFNSINSRRLTLCK